MGTEPADAKWGIVLLCDALGSKREAGNRLVERGKFFGTLEKTIKPFFESKIKRINDEIKQVKGDTTVGSPVISVFQDTLLITAEIVGSKVVDAAILLHFLDMSCGLFIYSLNDKILWRGAISIGEYIQPANNITLGPAVNDAASWFEKADWAGFVVTPKTGFLLDRLDAMSPERSRDNSAAKYSVPLANGGQTSLWTACWPKFGPSDKPLISKIQLFEKLFQFDVPPEALCKYKNTIEYFDRYPPQGQVTNQH